jgi:hypothetical protein
LHVNQNKFNIQWYNPKEGGDFKKGSVTTVNSGKKVRLGSPPESGGEWVLLVTF